MKKTKILATLGPASAERRVLSKMISFGMDAVRINTAYWTPERYSQLIKNLRDIKDMPVVMDLKGPEIRILANKDIRLEKGESAKISFRRSEKPCFNHRFSGRRGQKLRVNDGLSELVVAEAAEGYLIIKALSDVVIGDRSRVNIKGIRYTEPILSSQDRAMIRYGIENKVDYFALSYTRNKQDIRAARRVIGSVGIIAKIETMESVSNFDEILEESDGIMVARGDLGVEVASEKLPMIQKECIRKCNQAGKLVITATQMLQSMVENPVPTRAETSDVANAILDGSDVIMLSGETAVGKYPAKAVKEMANIAAEVEAHVKSNVQMAKSSSVSGAISKSIAELCRLLPITKVITLTRTGYTARMISRFRLPQEIIALTPQDSVKKSLELYYGITPRVFPMMPVRERIIQSAKYLLKEGLITKGDMLLFTAGVFPVKPGATNLIEIHYTKDLLDRSMEV